MRLPILIAGLALTLAACGSKGQADNSQNADDSLTAENIVSNDVTAIDAVTADAANMAADVDYSNLVDNSLDNASNQGDSATPPARRARPTSPPPEPAANTAANGSANTTQ